VALLKTHFEGVSAVAAQLLWNTWQQSLKTASGVSIVKGFEYRNSDKTMTR
jgi:hypothetical protein